jgi:hypothetical protein
MLGPGEIDHNINIHFRAELAPWVRHRPAVGYISARGNGTLLWAHGTDRWLILRPFQPARVSARKASHPSDASRSPGARSALADLAVDAKDPISFFCSVMRDETAPFEKREAAADRLLPYFHPRLAAIEARSSGQSHEDRLAALTRLLED